MPDDAQVTNGSEAQQKAEPATDGFSIDKQTLVEKFLMTDEAAEKFLTALDEEMPMRIRVADYFDSNVQTDAIVVKDGIMTAPVRMAKAMVQDYKGLKVLKCAKELRKACDFAKQIPITDQHPPEKIVTSQKQIKGWTSIPKFIDNDEAIDATVETSDSKIITDVKEKGKTDVSIGFHCDLVMQKGEFRGEKYDAIQTDIVLNHLAMGVDKGRCPAPSCGIGLGTKVDCADEGPRSDEERAMAHFNITKEEWEKLTDEQKKALIAQLPPRGTEGKDQELEVPKPGTQTPPPQEPEKPKSPSPAATETKIPEKLQEITKALGELLMKKAELTAEKIAEEIKRLKGMLDEIKVMLEAEKGTAPEEIEKASPAMNVINSGIGDLESHLKTLTKKIDSIMDTKPDKTRSEFEKLPLSGLDTAYAELTTKKNLKAPTSDSLATADAIDIAYAKAVEKRLGKK